MSKISLKHSGGNVVSLNSPTNAPGAADVAFKLPNADGSDGQALVTDGSGNLSFGNVAGGSARNLVINGAMQVAQRGTSTTTSGSFCVDRFQCFHGGTDEAPTFSQADIAAGTTPYTLGFRKSLKVTNGNQTNNAGSGDYVWFQNKYEAQDIANSGWNYISASSYITLSFWVKSSVEQNFYGYVETLDSPAYIYPIETGTLTADTWTKVTKTIPGNSNLVFDNNSDTGLNINLLPFIGTDFTASGVSLNTWAAYASGTRMPDNTVTWYETDDATFEFTGVQLEVGTQATPFEHRSFGEELLLCRRYYYRESIENTEYFNGLGKADSDGNSIDLNLRFPVRMRTTPTALEQAGAGTNYLIRGSSTLQCTGVPTYGDATQESATVRFTRSSHGISTNNVANCGAWGASFLGFSAEL